MRLSNVYREEARDIQSHAEAELPIRVNPDYLRKLRYQMFHDRYVAQDDTATARNSVTGY